ncbi:Protein transport protein SEC61 subunit alpha [Geodia barretti]|uniref:Protein transport protein SEC61 subunit alpha n=1 Tax=Geodia barretti TaxID=519541 RepID=A0AA35RUA2_GEOBA|nr:Protein transport protein SEC61 subunit alpha [Geodia barretti]
MLPVRHSDGVGSISIATYYLLGYFNIMERKPHKKLLCMVVTLCQSVYCLMSGMYGTPSELGIFTSLIIILQLCGAGLMVMMLNELLEKYGMGSSDIFIVTNICGTVFWKAFSPVTINTGSQAVDGQAKYGAARSSKPAQISQSIHSYGCYTRWSVYWSSLCFC